MESGRWQPLRRIVPVATGLAVLALLLVIIGILLPERTQFLWMRLFNPSELTMRIGVLPDKPMGLSSARALQDGINESTPFTVEVEKTEGFEDHITRLRNGDLDFISLSGGLGLDPEEFLALARVGQEFLHIVVPVNSPVREIADIARRRVVTEMPRDPSHQIIDALIAEFDFKPPLELVEAPFAEVADLLDTGAVDAGFFVEPVLGTGTTNKLLRSGRFRLLGVPQARYLSQVADGMQVAELPMGAYGINRSVPPEPLPALALNSYVVTRVGHSDAQVRALLRELFSADVVQRLDFSSARLSEDWARQTPDYALHPAARRFFDRDEPVSADQFEIAAFFLAALLALFGGVRMLYLQWRRRLAAGQRARIGVIMHRLLELDGELRAADPTAVREILDRMTELENEAEQLWLDGRVATEDLENFFERSGAKIRNAHLHLLATRMSEVRDVQEASLTGPPKGGEVGSG